MKTPRIILAAVLSIGLFAASCSDNSNDNGGTATAPLAGKWNISKVGSTVGGQEFFVNPPQNEPGCEKDYVQLNPDMTLIAGDYSSDSSPCALTTVPGTYTRTSNTITTVIGGTTTTQEILNLTTSELKLKDSSGAILLFVKG